MKGDVPMLPRHPAILVIFLAAAACAKPQTVSALPGALPPPPSASGPMETGPCGSGKQLTIHFYDVGEGLAALVDLPDGRHVLVDTGDSPHRTKCAMCAVQNEHLLHRLSIDLREAPIDVVWVTDQDPGDVGGAPEVLGAFKVGAYVDNGRDAPHAEVKRARDAAGQRSVPVQTVDPDHPRAPIADGPDVKLRAIVPAASPLSCEKNPSDCASGLRIDFCRSSILLLGDAEQEEDAVLNPGGPVTLLQVAHHGSATSTSPGFLAQAKPAYAVISAAKRGEGAGRESCDPRASVVRRLTEQLGGGAGTPLESFDGESCDRAKPSDWVSVPASDRLWATARDGDVVLSTTGDGTFVRRVK